MQIVIIGTGNVATVMTRKLKAAGHTILQVFGRNPGKAAALASEAATVFCTDWTAINQHADVYLLCVADSALAQAAAHLHLQQQLVVHTAGAVSIDILKNTSAQYGVFYPFQSLSKHIEPLADIPMMIDGNTPAATEKLLVLAKSFSGKVNIAGDALRMQYHLCAVVTNNFSNYLFVLAEDYCKKHQMDFGNLLPLLDETTRRLHQFSPRQVQTGPAIRKDMGSVEQHLALLQQEPQLSLLYKTFSEAIGSYPW